LSKRGIRLHEQVCKTRTPEERAASAGKPLQQKNKRKPKEEKREYTHKKCPDCGSEDDFRLLSPKEPLEAYCIELGHKYICDGCKEVI
jgi:predicted RNA-binding Zn-ribbon protein involved in translation (DUF1610 family)